jgi:hypothetical protein
METDALIPRSVDARTIKRRDTPSAARLDRGLASLINIQMLSDGIRWWRLDVQGSALSRRLGEGLPPEGSTEGGFWMKETRLERWLQCMAADRGCPALVAASI